MSGRAHSLEKLREDRRTADIALARAREAIEAAEAAVDTARAQLMRLSSSPWADPAPGMQTPTSTAVAVDVVSARQRLSAELGAAKRSRAQVRTALSLIERRASAARTAFAAALHSTLRELAGPSGRGATPDANGRPRHRGRVHGCRAAVARGGAV